VGCHHDDHVVFGSQLSKYARLELVELSIRFSLRQGQRHDSVDSLFRVMLDLSQPIEDLAGSS